MSAVLQIHEIERLAKAGVTITMAEITPQSDWAAYPTVQTQPKMAGAVWGRWRQSRHARGHPEDYGAMVPFELLASQHGDKVWLSVHPTNFNYEPFQLQDHAAIFPSDALMAQLALWEQNHK